MADNVNKSNIDDIVSGVRKALEMGELSDSGISFEFVDESEEKAPAVTLEDDEPIADAQPSAPEPAAPSEPEPEIKPEENVAAKKPIDEPASQKEEAESVARGIWTTYVPRSTDVSDTYRMRKNDYVEQKVTPEPTKKERELPITVSEDEPDLIVDPTAEPECESKILDATLISSGTNAATAENDEVATFFKFDNTEAPISEPAPEPAAIEDAQEEPEEQEEPEINESIPDREADEISEPPSEEALTDSEASESEDIADPEPAAIEQDPNKPYVMPDPDVAVPIVNLPVERQTMALEVVDEEVGRRRRSEYTSFSDKDGFYDSFIDSIMSVRVRIVSTIFISLMLLFFENSSFFGIDIVRLMRFDGVGGGMAIITLPFIAGIFLLALPEVIYSFVSLSKKKLVPEIFLSVTAAVIVLYYALIISFDASDSYSLFGFLFAILTLLAMFSGYYKKKADFEAFKIASAGGEKKVVDRKLTRNLPAEHRALDGKIESYKSRTARVFKTNFVSDFSARSTIISENTSGGVLILAVSLGVALVAGVVAFFIPGGIVAAAKTFATVYMLTLPASAIISHKIPFYHATTEAAREKSALIGEKSFYDYSGIDVITFDDTEIFGKDDVNLQRIMVYGRKENLPKALQQMSALFTVVGGPLAYIFANAVDRRVSPADNVAVDTDGIIGAIDGIEIMAGSAEFMESRGVKIPYDPEGDSSVSQTTRIMYASEGGEIYAKFYVRYMLSEEFTMMLPILLDEGVKPLVYTRDPNINDGLFRSLTAGKDSIRVLKKQNLPSSEVRLYSRISLGMVTLGDKGSVINAILLSKKYTSLQARFAFAELPAMCCGAVMGVLLSALVKTPMSSLLLSLWYVGWSIAISVIAKKIFGSNREKLKDKED